MISPRIKSAFQKKILDWYFENKRDLPWRTTREPYSILISEVMSQQTQLTRVVPKYKAWIEKFPVIESLANAKLSDVLQYWSGLGYNRRALHLKKTAEVVVEKYHGHFPQTENELKSLPGIGRYTARALLCFSFDHQIAVVDTNVRKVILTQILIPENSINQIVKQSDKLTVRDSGSHDFPKINSIRISEQAIEDIAKQLLPAGRAYEWNQALMDYAAAVLKNEKIPIPKQSKFIGSHRYYRGQILKQLLQKNNISIVEIGPLIKNDYNEDEREWLRGILEELMEEGFIICKNNIVSLVK
jgi:A/G-specific adenine glycosylase